MTTVRMTMVLEGPTPPWTAGGLEGTFLSGKENIVTRGLWTGLSAVDEDTSYMWEAGSVPVGITFPSGNPGLNNTGESGSFDAVWGPATFDGQVYDQQTLTTGGSVASGTVFIRNLSGSPVVAAPTSGDMKSFEGVDGAADYTIWVVQFDLPAEPEGEGEEEEDGEPSETLSRVRDYTNDRSSFVTVDRGSLGPEEAPGRAPVDGPTLLATDERTYLTRIEMIGASVGDFVTVIVGAGGIEEGDGEAFIEGMQAAHRIPGAIAGPIEFPNSGQRISDAIRLPIMNALVAVVEPFADLGVDADLAATLLARAQALRDNRAAGVLSGAAFAASRPNDETWTDLVLQLINDVNEIIEI